MSLSEGLAKLLLLRGEGEGWFGVSVSTYYIDVLGQGSGGEAELTFAL